MSETKKVAGFVVALLLGTIVLTSVNVSAFTIVSNEEWMWTRFTPLYAYCSNNVTGWTPYGQGHPQNGTNTVDYSWQQGPDLRVVMYVSARSNSTISTTHYFSLEVYDEAGWIRQSSIPWGRDWYQVTFSSTANGTETYRNATLSVYINGAQAISQYWCVYYTDQVTCIGQGFQNAYQDYWAKLR